MDASTCTQCIEQRAPNGRECVHPMHAIMCTQCTQTRPPNARNRMHPMDANESTPASKRTLPGLSAVPAYLAFPCLPCLPNVRSRLRQPCSLGSLGDLRVPRPLGVCIYAFGSRSSATRRKLPTVRSACGLNRDRVWHPGHVGRCVRVSAIGPGRRSRCSRALLRQSAALCVVASLRG